MSQTVQAGTQMPDEARAAEPRQQDVAAFLRNLALFAGLTDEELARLIEAGEEVEIAPGGLLIREGEPGDAMFVILSGDFEVTKRVEESDLVIARRGPGEVIGEIALLDDEPRSASVRALSKARLLKIDRHAFDDLLRWSPTASRAILKTVAARLRNTEVMLRQSEKMASLGTLAAGVAHELNNPAAAARRAARQLAADLETAERLSAELSATSLDSNQQRALRALQARLGQDNANAPVDPLARSDLESEVQDWLDQHRVEEAWEIAPRLVGLGFDAHQLEEVVAPFPADLIPTLLGWLAAEASVRSLLGEISSSTARLSTIVGAIKSYVYLDQAPVQEVDVHAGLEDTLVILSYKLKHGVTIKREYEPNLPRIEAYASELNQVWTNLVDNAIDAMNGQGEIVIRTYSEGAADRGGIENPQNRERVVVEICDNGPGIPAAILPRIFDPFFTTKPIGKGSGLGLHISYNIVTLKHHGSLSAQSRPGATCFKVVLPVRLADQQGEHPEKS